MGAVLLLNATYEPLSIIPEQRAVALLLRERVEAATDDTLVLHGPSTALALPTVLRLRHYVNVPRRGAGWTRRGVLQRDGYACIYCGVRAGDVAAGRRLSKRDFTLDHILPRSRGGKNTWGNTACACQPCNQRKGNRTPHEAGMPLRWEPKRPRVAYLVASGEIPTAWRVYLEI